MPKLVTACHMGLLFVLSAVLFPSLAACVGYAGEMAASDALRLAIFATGLSAVMLLTEVFSGMRWLAVLVVVAALIGLLAVWGEPEVPAAAVSAWAVAWHSVLLWFAILAQKARGNR